MTEWNKELEKKILKKSKNALTYKILKILLVIACIFVLYVYVISFISNKYNEIDKSHYFSMLVIDWTVPNVRGTKYINGGNTNIFSGTNQFSYNLTKRVGKENITVGEAYVTKKIFNSKSFVNLINPNMEELNKFSFYAPTSDDDTELEDESYMETWSALEKLPEGTVAELAFSTKKFMEPEELIDELSAYDIDIVFVPVYTGEEPYFFSGFNWGWNRKSNRMRMTGNGIGLTGGMEHDENYMAITTIETLNKETIKESKELMLKNMEELLEQPDSYLEDFLFILDLEKKYKYIKENGFKAYGAVVTGPTKELLKLKNVQFIQDLQLGEVELWNWYDE